MLPTDHDCLDHLRTMRSSWVETHGLACGPYEHCSEEWERCAVCGMDYEVSEVALMMQQRNAMAVAVGAGA